MSRRPALAVAAALLAVLAEASGAAQETPAAAVDTARMDRARELVGLTNPFDVMVAGNLRGWESAIARTLTLDPAVASMEKRYPGIGKAGIEAARPLARRYSEVFVTRVNDRTARIVAERLSADEMGELIRFYGSPLGRRAVKQLFAAFDSAGLGRQIADEKARTGTAEVSLDDVKKQGTLAARRAAPEFSAADQLEMMRFAQKPAAKKFTAAREVAEGEIVEMANNPDPEFVAAQNEALRKGMIAFADSRKRP